MAVRIKNKSRITGFTVLKLWDKVVNSYRFTFFCYLKGLNPNLAPFWWKRVRRSGTNARSVWGAGRVSRRNSGYSPYRRAWTPRAQPLALSAWTWTALPRSLEGHPGTSSCLGCSGRHGTLPTWYRSNCTPAWVAHRPPSDYKILLFRLINYRKL